jgi:hypothetical protein
LQQTDNFIAGDALSTKQRKDRHWWAGNGGIARRFPDVLGVVDVAEANQNNNLVSGVVEGPRASRSPAWAKLDDAALRLQSRAPSRSEKSFVIRSII